MNFVLCKNGQAAPVVVEENAINGLAFMAGKFCKDIELVTDCKPQIVSEMPKEEYAVLVATCGNSAYLDKLEAEGKVDLSAIRGKREVYGIFLCDGEPEKNGITKEAALFNVRPVLVPESYHKGTEPQQKRFIYCDKENVIMTAFKLAEDGSGDVVMRFSETSGKETRAAIVCDMLDCGFKADFLPCEIKTFRVDAEGRVTEENFLEGNIK